MSEAVQGKAVGIIQDNIKLFQSMLISPVLPDNIQDLEDEMNTPRRALQEVREWAKGRLRAGAEPPWSYYRLMQLIEAVDVLESGEEAVSPTDCSQQSEPHSETPLPQGENIYRLDTARPHRAGPPIRLPT